MCLLVAPFNVQDDYDDAVELNCAGISMAPYSSFCITTFASKLAGSLSCMNKAEAYKSIEIIIPMDDEKNNKSTSISEQASPIVEHNKLNTTVSNKLWSKIRHKVEAIGSKSEALKDELLITLVGVTGQNAMQMPWSSTSSSGLRYVAMAANCMAFISLLSGVLLRSKATNKGEDRRQIASNVLVLLGVSLTATGPMLNMSMNIPGIGGYFFPLVCLMPLIGVFT